MPFKDLREFIAKLEQEGQARRIRQEVDWDLEAGAMVRRADEAQLPALLFERVKGYPEGYTLFGEALASHRRVGIAMGLSSGTPVKTLQEEYLRRRKSLLKPVTVGSGPCKENIHLGDYVDLLEFPVPFVHEGDGGRYIGTWHLTITRDLESSWVNWGMYRHMLHDRRTIGIQSGPVSHIMRIREGWLARKRPMEIAIVIGTEPVSTLCAATNLPYGVAEADIAGGIRGEPVELVKCETVDLAVPATAEIVIEGEVSCDETRDEGPFGEYTGFTGGHREPRPVIHVKAVTHRNNPIFTMGCEGMPVTSSHVIMSVTRAAEFHELLKGLGLPVTAVSLPVEASNMMAVVAARPPVMADEFASAIWGSRAGRYTPYVIIVEDDVDPFDMGQVVHAMVSRCHPGRGIVKHEFSTGNALLPYLTPYEQRHLIGAKVYFDCTWPRDWNRADVPRKSSLASIYPADLQKKVMERLADWREDGPQAESKEGD